MSSSHPKAIPTEYAGIRFRSRLEARWAVFFDALGVKWEYEREGYQLASGWYVPDFWLPSWGWVELKGQEPTGQECALMCDLATSTDQRGIILPWSPLDLPYVWSAVAGYGSITLANGNTFECGYDELPHSIEALGDCDHLPCVCPKCRRFGFEYSGRGERVCGVKCLGPNAHDGKEYTFDAFEIQDAISTVRSHRFWDPQKAA